MRYNEDLPLKARVRRKKIVKKIRFSILVVLTIVAAYYISYSLSKSNEDNISVSNNKETVVTEENSNIKESVPGQNNNQSQASPTNDSIEGTPLKTAPGTLLQTPTPALADSTAANQIIQGSNPDYEALKKDLENYIKRFNGKYGIYYLNLVDGYEFGINQTDEFVAASTIKIPINLYLFKKIKEGSVNPKGTMTYQKSDYEGGTGSLQYKPLGSKYTIRKLSMLSIEESDNVATNMLIRLVGLPNVKKFMTKSGGVIVINGKNVTCPKDMGLYMKMVYDFYNEDSVLGQELMSYFMNTIFSDRIPKLLPKDVKVAHKIGNQVRTINDVGIVFAEEPYVLAVLSKNVNESEAYDVVARISKMVYDSVTKE